MRFVPPFLTTILVVDLLGESQKDRNDKVEGVVPYHEGD